MNPARAASLSSTGIASSRLPHSTSHLPARLGKARADLLDVRREEVDHALRAAPAARGTVRARRWPAACRSCWGASWGRVQAIDRRARQASLDFTAKGAKDAKNYSSSGVLAPLAVQCFHGVDACTTPHRATRHRRFGQAEQLRAGSRRCARQAAARAAAGTRSTALKRQRRAGRDVAARCPAARPRRTSGWRSDRSASCVMASRTVRYGPQVTRWASKRRRHLGHVRAANHGASSAADAPRAPRSDCLRGPGRATAARPSAAMASPRPVALHSVAHCRSVRPTTIDPLAVARGEVAPEGAVQVVAVTRRSTSFTATSASMPRWPSMARPTSLSASVTS